METCSTGDPSRPRSGRGDFVSRHPLLVFFLIAYGGSWLVELPYLRVAGHAVLPFAWPVPFPVSAAIAPYAGPTLAAFLVAGATEGREGTRRLLRRIGEWRVGLGWYAFAILGVPAITLFGAAVLPGVLGSFQAPGSRMLLTYPLVFAMVFFIGGPLGEEPGWRGFALPRLQCRYGPLVGSLILGPIHVLWHLPLYWVPQWGTPRGTVPDLVWYALSGIALTFVYTWLFNNARQSVLLVTLAHTSVDAFAADRVFPDMPKESLLPFTIGFGVLAVLLIVLTRGRLGYKGPGPEVVAAAVNDRGSQGADP